MVFIRGKGAGGGRRGSKGGQMLMDWDLSLGGAHTIQYRDDVL